jgi:hypothetical protein
LSRGRTTFRQRDVCAAIRAVLQAGCEVVRIEVDRDGKIIVVTSNKGQPGADVRCTSNEWDALLHDKN